MNSMFESIRGALENKKNNGGKSGLGEILKTEKGKTYEVKLLPYLPDPANGTFFEYYMHGWESFATGSYVQIMSPTTFGERDPISEERFKILKLGSQAEKDKINKVRRGQKWLVNVLVIKDPTNPENEGKVKILRYGKQLDKIIMDGISGDEAEEFGEKIFEFGPGNAILKIKVDDQGEFASYTSSRFTTSTKFTLNPAEQDKILGETFDLRGLYEKKSFEEVQSFFNTHYHVASAPKEEKKGSAKSAPVNSDDDIINELKGAGATNFDTDDTPPFEAAGTGDDEIDAILKGLN